MCRGLQAVLRRPCRFTAEQVSGRRSGAKSLFRCRSHGRPVPNSDWGIDGEIEFKNEKGQASGSRLYLQLKSGDSYLYERKADRKEIFRIKNPRHAEYWQAHEYPVMLVIRTSDGEIRWMNVTDYLRKHGSTTKQIVFDGEPFTALNVAKNAPSFQIALPRSA
jgi:hypothetical protein